MRNPLTRVVTVDVTAGGGTGAGEGIAMGVEGGGRRLRGSRRRRPALRQKQRGKRRCNNGPIASLHVRPQLTFDRRDGNPLVAKGNWKFAVFARYSTYQ